LRHRACLIHSLFFFYISHLGLWCQFVMVNKITVKLE